MSRSPFFNNFPWGAQDDCLHGLHWRWCLWSKVATGMRRGWCDHQALQSRDPWPLTDTVLLMWNSDAVHIGRRRRNAKDPVFVYNMASAFLCDVNSWPQLGRYLVDKETPTGTCAVTIVDKERSLTTRLGAANKQLGWISSFVATCDSPNAVNTVRKCPFPSLIPKP